MELAATPTLTRTPPAPGGAPAQPPLHRRSVALAHPAVLVGAVLLVASAALLLWAGTRPSFDAYGWLVWGRKTIDGALDTNAAPSWKPLPYLLTVPFALAGRFQVWLWMWASTAISLSGVVFAARIAHRLTAAPPERRYAGLAAGAFAGVALLGIQDLSHYLLSAQSDPMIVALCLGAVDAHLSGRPRLAFALGVLGALGRPEVWPFLGLYGVWGWRRIPAMRREILAGVIVLLVLWFGIPALSARSPFVAGSNALGSGRALHSDKVLGTIGRFTDLHALPLEIAAAVSVALAAWRRDRVVLVLAAGVIGWVVVEVAFALHGWPGLPRYMFEAAGVTVVIAAVLVGRLLSGEHPGCSPAAARGRVAIVLALVLAGALIPTAISRGQLEHRDLRVQRARTQQIGRLATTIRDLGGAARLRGCGEPLTHLQWQTILAWNLRLNVSRVGWKYGPAVTRNRPIVLFSPTPHGGWRVQALHQRTPACRTLPR